MAYRGLAKSLGLIFGASKVDAERRRDWFPATEALRLRKTFVTNGIDLYTSPNYSDSVYIFAVTHQATSALQVSGFAESAIGSRFEYSIA